MTQALIQLGIAFSELGISPVDRKTYRVLFQSPTGTMYIPTMSRIGGFNRSLTLPSKQKGIRAPIYQISAIIGVVIATSVFLNLFTRVDHFRIANASFQNKDYFGAIGTLLSIKNKNRIMLIPTIFPRFDPTIISV